jgi:hypothetical protein
MEREQALLRDIYKILGVDFKPKITDIPINTFKIKDIDIRFHTKRLGHKIEKFSSQIKVVKPASFKRESMRGKIDTITISIPVSILSKVDLINSIPIRRFPVPWRMLSDEEKLFLLQEIRTKWPQFSMGLKIIGVYREIPIERIDIMTVEENTGVLSFNLKEKPLEEIRKMNLLVFKFVEDEKIRSLVF